MPMPIITVRQMREWEAATWATGQTAEAVIRQVGACLARRALRLTLDQDSILILAGRGRNGDDARCAAAHVAGRRIEVLEVKDPAASAAELAASLQRRPALVIDGLFGIGLNRSLDPGWIELMRTLNASGVPVLAVDVPSGMNADTGEPWGAVVQATVTVTLGAPKAGLLRPAAWPAVGRLEVEPDIGLAPCPCSSEQLWTLPQDFAGYPPPRPAAAHKGTFGHVGMLAGSEGYHGAAVLAARGAQRAQPGLITLHTASAVYAPVAGQLQAVMVRPWRRDQWSPDAFSTILCGPGLAAPGAAAELREAVVDLWHQAECPVIVDASALDWLPSESAPAGAVRVITPHPGEAARMLGTSSAEVQQDRPAAVRALSHRFGGCWVVLKGHQTLVGRQEGPITANPSGNPHLAQGGSGDLLAGYLAGLLAQPSLQGDPGRAVRYAVWQHGLAADELSTARRAWVVEDLAARIGDAA